MILILILALCLIPIALLVIDVARLSRGSGRHDADPFAGSARGPRRLDGQGTLSAHDMLEAIPAMEERRNIQVPFPGSDRRKTAALPAAAPVRRPLGVPAELEAASLQAIVDAASDHGRRRRITPATTESFDDQAACSA
jgi:hypothetical protein